MDLKTYLFVHGINIRQFARHMGMDYYNAIRLVERGSRPRARTAAFIEYATGGLVTVDEMIHPYKYPVSWPGDKARSSYKNQVNLIQLSPDELSQIPKFVKETKRRKGNGSTNKKSKVGCQKGQQEKGSERRQQATQDG